MVRFLLIGGQGQPGPHLFSPEPDPDLPPSLCIRLFALTLLLFSTDLFASIRPLNLWQGEYFTKNQGAFYFKYALTGSLSEIYDIRVRIVHTASGRKYTFRQVADEVRGSPSEIWKIPAGRYRLRSIRVVEIMGKRRSWYPHRTKPIVFQVRGQHISNLGIWVIRPHKRGRLLVKIHRTRDQYQDRPLNGVTAVAGVISGFTGRLQSRIGGQAVSRGARHDYQHRDEARLVLKHRINTRMSYRINLFKNNRFSRRLAGVLQDNEELMRGCFLNRNTGSTGGYARFRLSLSPKTKGVRRIRTVAGSLPRAVSRCLSFQLRGMTFPVLRPMQGSITYHFRSSRTMSRSPL